MTPLSIAERLGGDTFLAQAFGHTYRYVPDAVPGAGALMTFTDLNDLLAVHRLEPPRLRLSADGEMLPQQRYATAEVTRRRTVWHRLQPTELNARLAEGASLVIDAVDELHPPVRDLAQELERWLRTHVQVNLYASWTGREGFGVHWDDHDVIVVQLDGAKRWRIYGPTRRVPLALDTDQPEPPPDEPVAELVLRPGDVLYLPRGWWHAVVADQGTHSLHLTAGLRTHTGADLLTWLGGILRGSELVRADLPVHGTAGQQGAHLEQLRKEVLAAFEDPALIARYVDARDAEDPGRLRPSLPYLGGPPPDPGLVVRLTSGRARLTDPGDGGTVVFRGAGSEWEFAPAAAPMLRLLLDGGERTFAELAGGGELSVDQVAAVVGELVGGRVAAITGPR
ncbi:cupin domain-containing protein [Streptomyces xiamenensis]|uniref:cupin domain-containing protein n=1 Tax=Streptomyces xiamenensis TaxID=408015 RepID=UPI0035DCF7BF